MSLRPINQEQVQQTAQVVLAYLSDPKNATPNNMLEGIVSGKSLLKAILTGELVICQSQQTPTPLLNKKTTESSEEDDSNIITGRQLDAADPVLAEIQ